MHRDHEQGQEDHLAEEKRAGEAADTGLRHHGQNKQGRGVRHDRPADGGADGAIAPKPELADDREGQQRVGREQAAQQHRGRPVEPQQRASQQGAGDLW